MMNLLIAIMSDTYERVMERNEVESRMARIQDIIDEEALMSKSERRDPQLFPAFLQVLHSQDGATTDRWSGLGGKITTEVGMLKGEILKTQEEVFKTQEDVGHMKGCMIELMGEVAEIKALLQGHASS